MGARCNAGRRTEAEMVGNVGANNALNQIHLNPQPVVKHQGEIIETSYKARNTVMSGDELMQKMGAPPKSDMKINLGIFGVKMLNTRSTEYKEALSELAKFHKMTEQLGKVDIGASAGGVVGLKIQLQKVMDCTSTYIAAHITSDRKQGRRDVMNELHDMAQNEMAKLNNLPNLPGLYNADINLKTAMIMAEGGIFDARHVSGQLSDTNLVHETGGFGAGAVNQVSLATYSIANAADEIRVLKPLQNQMKVFVGSENAIGIDRNDTRMAARNLASAVVADAMGFRDMVPMPDIIIHNDQICLAMPKAPGEEFLGSTDVPAAGDLLDIFNDEEADLAANKPVIGNIDYYKAKRDGDGIWVIHKSVPNDFPLMTKGDDTDRPELTANLQKGLLDLQVLDVLCGQVDRHAHNFFVQVNGNEVKITGIDNDTAFGKNTNGIDRLSVAIGAKPPFAGPPPLMSREAFDNLKAIDRVTYRSDLVVAGLDNDEVNASMSRLDAMIVHADKLANAGMVVDDFVTWSGNDPTSGKAMNASQFLEASKLSSYVASTHGAMQLAVHEGRLPKPLDPTIHNLDV